MLGIFSGRVGLGRTCLLCVVLFLSLFCQVGCAPSWYDGEVATLVADGATTITRLDKELGDCYRVFTGLPTVYEISRPSYTLRVAHGNRYWPEFFLAAESNDHGSMEIIGPEIKPVRFAWGADHRRLEEARGLHLSHQTVSLEYFQGKSIQVAILDSQWDVLGVEELTYEIQDVNCFGWDSL